MPTEDCVNQSCACNCHAKQADDSKKSNEEKPKKTTKRSKKEKPIVVERMRIVPGGVVSFEDVSSLGVV